MRILSVLSQKGGAGKSTVAIHLAVFFGADTVLVDCDRQESARKWGDRRTADTPDVISYRDFSSHGAPAIADLARSQGTKTLIFDGQPRASALEVELTKMSDLVVIPFGCTILDLESVQSTFDIVKAAGKPAIAVLTKANSRTREYAEAVDWVKAQAPEMPILTLSSLVIYSRSLTSGTAVSEISRSEAGAAGLEIEKLHKTVKGMTK